MNTKYALLVQMSLLSVWRTLGLAVRNWKIIWIGEKITQNYSESLRMKSYFNPACVGLGKEGYSLVGNTSFILNVLTHKDLFLSLL